MKEAVIIPAQGEAYQGSIVESAELEALQEIVGGFIEAVPTDAPVSVFCNEEGKIQGLPMNWRATHLFGGHLASDDVIAGNVVVLGDLDDRGNTTGLIEEEIETLLDAANAISDTDCRRWSKWHDLRRRKAAATTDEEREALAQEEDELRDSGIEEMLEEDLKNPEGLWWISFADPDKPKGEQFLGVVIVRGGGMQEAVQNAWTMGINPGGQVMAAPIKEEEVDPKFLNRLLSKKELEEAGLA